jgi:hypothetical protein
MNFRKIVLTIIALMTFTAAGFAQGTKAPENKTARFGNPTGIARKYQSYISGVVKKVDKDEIVLTKTRFGVDTSIKLDAKTKFVTNEKPGKLEDLKVGDLVFVDVNKNKKTGEMSAKKVVSGVTPIS